MPDILDAVQEKNQFEINSIIANRVKFSGESLEYCEQCGEEIANERRKAIAGVKTCFSCQSKLEQRKY